MSRQRAPWWIYVVAVSFAGFFCFTIYADFAGPEPFGFASVEFNPNNLFLKKVEPGSALERAGIRDGDRILTVDGDPIRNLEQWRRHRALFRANQPIDVEVERNGTRFHASLILRPGWFPGNSGKAATESRINYFGWRGAGLILTLCSFWFVFLRPHDFSVRMYSLALAALAAALSIRGAGYGWTAMWRNLPLPIALLFAIPAFSVTIMPLAIFCFFAVFPRDYFASRRRLLACCAPGLLLAPLLFPAVWPLLEPVKSLPVGWNTLAVMYTTAGCLVLILNYRRLQDLNDRRRIRALIPATVTSAAVILHVSIALEWSRWFGTEPPLGFSDMSLAVDAVLFLFAIFLVLYAILKHRVFEFSVIVRRGLQYATARGVLASIVPVSVALLVADLVLHRSQSLAAIMEQRGWLYAALGAGAFVAKQKRDRWMNGLDKRFFRERYNAQQILREMVEEVRAAHTLEEIALRAVNHIEAALHPDFIALMVRDVSGTEFRCLASAPAGAGPRGLMAESKLMAAFRLFAKPLQVSLSESGWLKQQLPHQDTEFLRQSRIDLMVPIALTAGAREALLVLGARRSEEPYSSEDQELLLAIANGLALLLERTSIVTPISGLGECPACGTCYDSGIAHCAIEGAQVKASPAPRLLVGRYRLEKRLGSGGMGTVYKALDTSLERDVAIKLIRDDLVTSSDIAERFRREAKATAALAHPNLVTVYDFGVDPDARAFLIMEMLEGQTLRQELQAHKRLDPARTLEVMRPVCAAVDAAHQLNIIHRDLKAENIFLARGVSGETPKVLDFGLAKFTAQADAATLATLDTGVGVLVGTPQYMSPEQLKGDAASISWDLWALSVILYESLTGAMPFAGAAIAQLHNAISNGRFTPVSQHLPDGHNRLSGFFSNAFSLDPNARPSSAQGLAAGLREALEKAASTSA